MPYNMYKKYLGGCVKKPRKTTYRHNILNNQNKESSLKLISVIRIFQPNQS